MIESTQVRTPGTFAEESPGIKAALSLRAAVVLLLLLTATSLSVRIPGAERSLTAGLKVVLPTLAIGIVPGALLMLLWRPRRQLTMLEVAGYGIVGSFGLVHLATVFAIVVHMGVPIVLMALLLGSLSMAVSLLRQRQPAVAFVITGDELIVVSLLVIVAVFLYLQGSPVDSFEDRVHVSIARRLAHLEHPRLDNLYFSPGIVYTYPFPGTHAFIALIGRLGDIDTLFLYHKLRFFWGPAAILMLYLTARAVFAARSLAAAVAVTACVLVSSGIFAMVPGFPWGWGQLVPYSHASDVAMNVLLPGLLAAACSYLRAGSKRERAFFMTVAVALVFMLTVVHIREVVQFAVYLVCFVALSGISRPLRSYVRPAIALLASTLTIATIYVLWQRQTVTIVSDIVLEQRDKLAAVTRASSIEALLFGSAWPLLSDFLLSFEQMFGGLTPFFLFAGPVVIVLFRRQPLVWLVCGSMIAYLLVMSVPLLAISYIYATYYEILFTPVRNVILFVYLIAGALIYVGVLLLERVDRLGFAPLLAGAAAGALALLASLTLNRSHTGFFVPLIAAYVLTFVWVNWKEPVRLAALTRYAVMLIVGSFAVVALWPDHPPAPPSSRVNVRWTAGLSDDERGLLERRFSLTDGAQTPDYTSEVNVWQYTLTDLRLDNVRALVGHPNVVDTQNIDRRSFVVTPQPTRGTAESLAEEYVSWMQYPGQMLSIATAVLIGMLGFVLPAILGMLRRDVHAEALDLALREPFYRRALPFVLFIVPFGLWSARPALSPLALIPMPPFGRVATPLELFARTPCTRLTGKPAPLTEDIPGAEDVMVPDQQACPPNYPLVRWVEANISSDGIFAINRWNPYLPTVFMPQQVVAFPGIERAFVHEEELFSVYYRFFAASLAKHRVQPFFNAVETSEERASFVRTLGVTHILVDPAYYEEMRAVLDRTPEQYELRYNDGRWAVYEVKQSTNHTLDTTREERQKTMIQ